jgi:hypothetical protein
VRHHGAQALAQQALPQRARHLLLDHGAADVEQVVVLDPDGQVVSQLRQLRQRSRCSWVLAVTGSPSSTCLIR